MPLTESERIDRLERAIVELVVNLNRVVKVHDAPDGPLDQITREDRERKAAEQAATA